jgi:hypothetical protein
LKDVIDNVPRNGMTQWEFGDSARIARDCGDAPLIVDVIEHPALLAGFYRRCAEKLPAGAKFGTYRNLYCAILIQLDVVQVFTNVREDLREKDMKIHAFLRDGRGKLLDAQNPEYRGLFERNEGKVRMFLNEMKAAFDVKQPFQRLAGIHAGFEILAGILHLIGEKEVGADQIVPFALIGIVFANPLGLASTNTFLKDFIQPVCEEFSPLDHAVEYSRVQFMGTYGMIEEAYEMAMKEAQ